MSTTDPTGPVKAPKACFEEPTHVSAKADYFTDFNNKMKADGHYAGITTKIDAALVTVGKFRDAILEAMTGAKGTAKKRNEVETLMRGEQDELLSAVQVVCNANPVTAISHLESLGLSYRTRKPVTKNDIEIRHGENSGSFILLVRSPKWRFRANWSTNSAAKWSTLSAVNWSTLSAANWST